ncbi:MAG TPA: hypothetical protein VHZ74_16350 [Bryobacteraceae bacterium]|nr:hypothetical protein [Bryobacteraceae bacterium]
MATEKQILANRRNAQFSTGPRTAEGKSVSRLNAVRHGLTGQIDVRTAGEQQAHDEFCATIIHSLDPAEGIERQFAQSIAEDHWRLNRAKSLENNIFAITRTFHDSDGEMETPEMDAALATARTYIADPQRLNLLSMYERRIHGNMSRSLKQLTEIQTARRAAEAKVKADAEAKRQQAFEEACLLAELAEKEGIPHDPAQYPDPGGFVFSTAEITAAIGRVTRLKQAREAFCVPLKPSLRRHNESLAA